MKLENSVALVTGASRGIGRQLVLALLESGAKRVYAAARDPKSVADLATAHPDRVRSVRLDVTSASDLEALAREVPSVDVVFNNAGVLSAFGLLDTARGDLEREFATNFYGTLGVTRAMLPALERAGGGAVVNVLTVVSLASMSSLGGYSATKAAALSLTQALRQELKKKNIAVHAVFPGPVDTEMAKDITLPKTSAREVAEAIVAGVVRGEEDIAPDPMSRQILDEWRRDPKAVETRFGAM